MPRAYVCEFEGQTIANADGTVDLFEIVPATNKPIAIIGFSIDVTSELQEAQEEWLRLSWIRGHATGGSGGTAVAAANVAKLSPATANAGFAYDYDNTTIASTGTPVNLWSGAVNVRAGRDVIWTPEQYRWCTAAESTIVLRLMAAVTDDLTMSASVDVLEYG